MEKKTKRCGWANHNQLEQEYHDKKWGIPMFEDRELFKMLCLEGMQAGLSWSTILKKMGSLCEAYDDFIPEIVVNYDEEREEIMEELSEHFETLKEFYNKVAKNKNIVVVTIC